MGHWPGALLPNTAACPGHRDTRKWPRPLLGAAITELRISQGSVHMIDLLGDHSTGVPLQWTDVQG